MDEPCAPYILTKTSVSNEGEVVADTHEVYGRKISLKLENLFLKGMKSLCVCKVMKKLILCQLKQ